MDPAARARFAEVVRWPSSRAWCTRAALGAGCARLRTLIEATGRVWCRSGHRPAVDGDEHRPHRIQGPTSRQHPAARHRRSGLATATSFTPPSAPARSSDGIQGARLAVVPQCGHLSNLRYGAPAGGDRCPAGVAAELKVCGSACGLQTSGQSLGAGSHPDSAGEGTAIACCGAPSQRRGYRFATMRCTRDSAMRASFDFAGMAYVGACPDESGWWRHTHASEACRRDGSTSWQLLRVYTFTARA